jgi:hypothetical protein
MAIPEGHRTNLTTLARAFENGDEGLLECTDIKTGEPAYVICAIQRDGDDVELVPFARLFNGSPYDEVRPPEGADDIGRAH